jgi:RNA polymerase sigma-70 factor (ECF subfamily)
LVGNSVATSVEARDLDVGLLYAEHARFIGRVILRLVGDGPHVDDLLQETFLVAYRRRRSFDSRVHPRTWLYGIAINLCRRHRRGLFRLFRFRARLERDPAPTLPSTALLPEDHVVRSEALAQALSIVRALPFDQREVFVLYELEEMEGADIAQLLQIPLGTVWTRLHKARAKFMDGLRRRQRAKEGR